MLKDHTFCSTKPNQPIQLWFFFLLLGSWLKTHMRTDLISPFPVPRFWWVSIFNCDIFDTMMEDFWSRYRSYRSVNIDGEPNVRFQWHWYGNRWMRVLLNPWLTDDMWTIYTIHCIWVIWVRCVSLHSFV